MKVLPQTSALPDLDEKSLLDAFGREQAGRPGDFARRLFWQTIYPHAWIVARLVGSGAGCFEADRALISYCGRLTSVRQIDSELAEFASFRNHGFLRGVCRIRVSGRRLRKLAAKYLPP